MTRPPFRLSDDEARVLVARLQSINDMHPLNERDHCAFVRAFIRAVHEATHKTFSPTIYRWLPAAYAPERRPSTSTLAVEKELFADELSLERAGAAEVATSDAPQLAALIRTAVFEAIGNRPPQVVQAAGTTASMDSAFWRERAINAERGLDDAQAHAARLAGELLAARTVVEILDAELAAMREALQGQGAQLSRLTDEIEEARLCAMRAIDDVRGETRTWRGRCAAVEAKAIANALEDSTLLETFRQLAYQRGAAIPPALQKGVK